MADIDTTDYVGPCDSELLSEYIVQEERADTGLNMEVQVKQENHVQEGNSLKLRESWAQRPYSIGVLSYEDFLVNGPTLNFFA